MDRATASPSREFLLQQSVLTVLHDRYPASIRVYGRLEWAGKVASLIRDGFDEGKEFVSYVKLEFNSRARQAASAA